MCDSTLTQPSPDGDNLAHCTSCCLPCDTANFVICISSGVIKIVYQLNRRFPESVKLDLIRL